MWNKEGSIFSPVIVFTSSDILQKYQLMSFRGSFSVDPNFGHHWPKGYPGGTRRLSRWSSVLWEAWGPCLHASLCSSFSWAPPATQKVIPVKLWCEKHGGRVCRPAFAPHSRGPTILAPHCRVPAINVFGDLHKCHQTIFRLRRKNIRLIWQEY